jgi:hypothetical protein
MLNKWATDWSDIYLREMYCLHRPPDGSPCRCGSLMPPQYRCDDCVAATFFCKGCLLNCHRYVPMHRISVWNGSAWSSTSLCEQSFILILGDHTLPCPHGNKKNFLLGDTTGFHWISIVFCKCAHCPDQAVQLLQAHILPCSEDNPSTRFTFRVLQLFHLASTDAKFSASRFYALLQCSTHNLMPHLHENQFREFLRTTRQWMFLQDMKCAGVERMKDASGSSLALQCPACPRLGVNYQMVDLKQGEEYVCSGSSHFRCPKWSSRYLFTQQLSYDGSFQLVHKNKAFDNHDICLSDGLKYWVEQAAYKHHLEQNKDTAYLQSTRVGKPVIEMSACTHNFCNRDWNVTTIKQPTTHGLVQPALP